MADRANTLRPHIDLSGVGFGISDKFRNGLRRNRGICHHHIARSEQRGDGCNVSNDAIWQVIVKTLVDRMRYREEEKRVAVRSRSYGLGSANVSTTSRSALHNEWLMKPF